MVENKKTPQGELVQEESRIRIKKDKTSIRILIFEALATLCLLLSLIPFEWSSINGRFAVFSLFVSLRIIALKTELKI